MPDLVKSIVVVLPQSSLNVGAIIQASADVTLNVPDNTVDTQSLVWTSSNPAVASITPTTTGAQIKALSAGTTAIRAAIGTVAGTINLTVTMLTIDIPTTLANQLAAIPQGTTFILRDPVTGRTFTTRVDAP